MAYNNEIADEIRNKNIKIVGLICEKIISNELLKLGTQCFFSVDPYDKFDLMTIDQDKNKKSVQVKGSTPYFNKNAWMISSKHSGINISNMVSADEIYLISLPASKRPNSIPSHISDSSIIRMHVDMLNEDDNLVDGSFFLHRDNHKHMYEIVRSLSENEKALFKKYPTSNFS